MKWAFVMLLSVVMLGCTSIAPDGHLTPYHAQLENLRIDYALPGSARFLAGSPARAIEFPSHQPYPLAGGIAAVGWEFRRDIPQVQLDLVLQKISAPRFGPTVASAEWKAILELERMSATPGSTSRIFRDATGHDWQETTVASGGQIEARSFMRPIASDILLLLRLNLGAHLTDAQRAEALTIQENMRSVIVVAPLDGSSASKSPR